MRLSEFDFELSYRKGKFMDIADCLSRNAQRDTKFRDDSEDVTAAKAEWMGVVKYQNAFVNMWTNIFERGFDKGTLSVYNASIFRHPRSSLRLDDATIVRVRDGASASPLLGRHKVTAIP